MSEELLKPYGTDKWTTSRPDNPDASGVLALVAEYSLQSYIRPKIEQGLTVCSTHSERRIIHYIVYNHVLYPCLCKKNVYANQRGLSSLNLMTRLFEQGVELKGVWNCAMS